MSEAGVRAGQVYRHYKKGDLYLVLAVADYTGKHVQEDSYPDDYHAQLPSPPATGFPEGHKLVVYVGLYDNPHGNRPCARPLSEWEERLKLGVLATDGYVPRYALVSP